MTRTAKIPKHADIDAMSVSELRAACKDRGLNSKGNKAALLKCIKEPPEADKFEGMDLDELKDCCTNADLDATGTEEALRQRLRVWSLDGTRDLQEKSSPDWKHKTLKELQDSCLVHFWNKESSDEEAHRTRLQGPTHA